MSIYDGLVSKFTLERQGKLRLDNRGNPRPPRELEIDGATVSDVSHEMTVVPAATPAWGRYLTTPKPNLE